MPHIVCLRPLHPDAMARLHAEPDFKVTMLTEVNAETLREPMVMMRPQRFSFMPGAMERTKLAKPFTTEILSGALASLGVGNA